MSVNGHVESTSDTSSKKVAEEDLKPSFPWSWVRRASLLLLIVLAAYAAYSAQQAASVKKWLHALVESIVAYIEAQGEKAMWFYLGFTVVGVLALVPTTVMEFAGGFLFAPTYGLLTTWLLTCAAKFVANVIALALARHVLKDWVRRNFVERSELLQLVEKAARDEPYKMAFLVRGSMAPLSVKNYGLGVLDMDYMPILVASCVFSPFYAIQNLYFGSVCQDLGEVFAGKKASTAGGTAESGWASTIKSVLPVVFNVLLVLFLVKAIQSQIRKARAAVEEQLRAKPESKVE
ncbi:unnamed protein product [Polarella glacialis]|uniref:Uncharacterized protein n=1 Tax=Polarella glacialis TaxID=89957 RepID=A0A813D6Q7_POLGL|nr:unnamed protein product [Polarella glacialis]